jgi:autotransporter-associated beta strand protein
MSMKMSSHLEHLRKSLRSACVLAVLLVVPVSSPAQTTYYWDNNGTSAGFGTAGGTWDSPTPSNWSTSVSGLLNPGSVTTGLTDSLFFGNGGFGLGAGTITVNGTVSAGAMTFGSASGAVVLSGGTINLGGTGTIATFNSTNTIGSVIDGTVGLTKTGVGTLTLNGSAANTFTGGLNINGGTLALNFANMATPTNLINSGNALNFGGGILSITALTGSFDTLQTFGNVTVNSGGGSLLVNPNGGTSTTVTLGTLTTTASGGSFVVGRAAGAGAGTLTITTTSNVDASGIYGGRVIFFNGTANTGYDLATNTNPVGPGPFTLTAYTGYDPLNLAGGIDTANSRITATATLSASLTTNSLKFENPATAQTLTITAGQTLTLTSGGLLFTGTSVAQGPRIASGSITAGNGSGSYDLVIHTYNATAQNIAIGTTGPNLALVTTISSDIVNNGLNPVTLVKSGPGGLVISGANNTFTGGILVNEGNLVFNSSTAINNNPITFNANSTVHTFSGSTTSGNITLNNGSQLTILNNNSSFTVTGNVLSSSGGGISAANGGQGAITLSLNGTGNTFTGPIRFTSNNGTQPGTINVGSLLDSTAPGEGNIVFGAGTASPTANTFGVSTTAITSITLNNRRFQLAGDLVLQTINNNSSQAFTVNSDFLVTGTRAKNLTLGGTGTGISTLAGVIANSPTPTANGTVPIAVRTTGVVNAGGLITLGSVEGIVVGASVSGTGITAGTTIASINPSTRQVSLSAATTGAIGIGTIFTIPGAVNSISLDKAGTGTWILGGTNTYSGFTSVASGGPLVGTNPQAFGTNLNGLRLAGGAILSLRNDDSVTFGVGGTGYNILNTASNATINIDRVSGTGSNVITIGNLNTISTAGSWGLNFTGANGVSLVGGTLTTPLATAATTHTINNTIATTNGASLTLAGITVPATFATPVLAFTGSGRTNVLGAITQTNQALAVTVATGTVTLGGTNTYTGSTSVNSGTLRLGASNALPPTSAVNLGAGTLAVAGNTVNGTATGGVLTVTGAATIDFGNAGTPTTLSFGDSSAATWTGTLTITGYTGPGNSTASSTTRLFIGSSITLLPTQMAAITFSGYDMGGQAVQLNTGEVVPVGVIPEPMMAGLMAAAGLGLAGYVRRRRLNDQSA